jgi:hypothetical protein
MLDNPLPKLNDSKRKADEYKIMNFQNIVHNNLTEFAKIENELINDRPSLQESRIQAVSRFLA